MDVIKPFQWYKKEEIEQMASELRLQIENKRKRRLRADFIAEAAADYLDLGIVWESIPADDRGEIAAMIMPMQKEIIINDRSDCFELALESTPEKGYRRLYLQK